MCRVRLSPPKLPDVTRITSRLTVSFYGLNEFFPHPKFCLSPSAFWLLILVSCFQSHKLTKPNNTAFQVDCSLHNRFPPSSLGIATMTRSRSSVFYIGTNHIAATALHNSGSTEHSVPSLHWNAVKALLGVKVKDLTGQGFCQKLPVHPHYTFGHARPVYHPPLPPNPTYH